MSIMTWTDELKEQVLAELEAAQVKRDAVRAAYNAIYKKLKIRCDARIHHKKKKNANRQSPLNS